MTPPRSAKPLALRRKRQERRAYVEIFASGLDFYENAFGRKSLQVDGSCLMPGDVRFDRSADAAVWIYEDQFR